MKLRWPRDMGIEYDDCNRFCMEKSRILFGGLVCVCSPDECTTCICSVRISKLKDRTDNFYFSTNFTKRFPSSSVVLHIQRHRELTVPDLKYRLRYSGTGLFRHDQEDRQLTVGVFLRRETSIQSVMEKP